MGEYLLENYLRCCSVMYKLKTKTEIFKDESRQKLDIPGISTNNTKWNSDRNE